MNELDEETERLLKQVVDHFDKEDRSVRERQIRVWKKLKYYWAGFQRIWWSEVAHDWRVYDTEYGNEANQNSSYYDKPINIFRAYLESIIAALSVTVPSLTCAPDDADNPLDQSTAKAGNKICELVYKHIDAPLLWLHALFIYCTEGMIAAYSYAKEDYKFGSYSEHKYEDVEEEKETKVCPLCKGQLPDEQLTNLEIDEFDPGQDDVVAHDLLNQGHSFCDDCLQIVDPEFRKEKFIVTRLTGVTTKPKARQCVEVYGGLFVKVPNYAMRQEDCPYIIFAYETHYSNVIEMYPKLYDKFGTRKPNASTGGMYDDYEQWGRLSTQYFGEYPVNNVTIRNCWLRCSAFNVLPEDDAKVLRAKYPDGVKVVLANDQFAEAVNEALDDHWTIAHNPLSDYLHYDPLGILLTSVQEITNDITSLVLQTIEHGIPQTFADPSVVDFNAYRQTEVSPGAIYPVKEGISKPISEAFYEVKTANLSGEILPFSQKIQEAGQLASGALPSLFGGAAPNSSKTASQYAMSRNQSMQRLQNTWKMLNYWWKNVFSKVIPAYIKDVQEDEKIVQKDEMGNYINVFIRKAELQGKIGSVELESSDQLPVTWAQKKDAYMQLMQAGNPIVMQALTSPENLPELQAAIGLPDFVIPGIDDRQKQYEEIQILSITKPIMGAGPMGEPSEEPSVDIEPIVDNHQIESDICRRYLVSDTGRLLKTENPEGYRNILLHMKRHMDMMQVLSNPMGPTPPMGQPGQPGPPQGMPQQGPQGQQRPPTPAKPQPMASKEGNNATVQ